MDLYALKDKKNGVLEDMNTVTERDNYKMPEPFSGEITPEIRKKIAENKADVEKRKARLKRIHEMRKRLQHDKDWQ